MNTTLATRYRVTRDPESETPELAGVSNIVISENPHDGAHYEVCVWGNGVTLEQALNEASVHHWGEIGSVVADLSEIAEAISDQQYQLWLESSRPAYDAVPSRTEIAMARELCEEFVLNSIDTARGVVDITEDVMADLKEAPEVETR